MAINPQVLAMLLQSAPILLSALQKPYIHNDPSTRGKTPLNDERSMTPTFLNSLVDRGYDMSVVQDDMLDIANSNNFKHGTGYGMNDAADIAVHMAGLPAWDADDPKTLEFPSDIFQGNHIGGFNTEDLLDEVPFTDGLVNIPKSGLQTRAAQAAQTFVDPNNMKTLAQKLLTAKKPGLK